MRRRAFLAAMAGGLLELVPGRRAVASPPVTGERAIIYSLGRQHVTIVDANGKVVKSHFVSGQYGIPSPGRYRVYSKSLTAYSSLHPDLRWYFMVRFARSRKGNPIGFHSIPVRCGKTKCTPIQGPGQVGTALSAGCVRQKTPDAKWLYGFARLGTLVVVTR